MSQQSNPATLREGDAVLVRGEIRRVYETDGVCGVWFGNRWSWARVPIAVVTLATSGTEAAPDCICSDDEHSPECPLAQAAASPEGEGREAQLLSEMRDFANECLRRIESYPHLDGDELHSKDTYEDILKLCDLAALRQSAAPSGGAAQVTLQMLNLALAKSRWTGPFDPEIAVHELNKLLAQESKTGAAPSGGAAHDWRTDASVLAKSMLLYNVKLESCGFPKEQREAAWSAMLEYANEVQATLAQESKTGAAPSGGLRLSEEILVDAARLIRRRKRAGADNEEIEGCAMVCDAMRDDSFAQESKTGAVTETK